MYASEARCVQQHAPPDSGGVAWGGAGTGAGQRWSWGRLGRRWGVSVRAVRLGGEVVACVEGVEGREPVG
jgi:hypothetical protein